LARDCDDVHSRGTGADEMVMKPIAKPSIFNPSLGMAVKGMWSTTFTQAVIEAIEQDDSESPAESEAA
jgi:hypothetical protein